MRELDIGTKKHTTVFAEDEKGAGNANHAYVIQSSHPLGDNNWMEAGQRILFQNGPIKEAGVNGVMNEDLIAIVIDRLEGFQAGDYACDENAAACADLRQALANLRARTDARKARGVEGTSAK